MALVLLNRAAGGGRAAALEAPLRAQLAALDATARLETPACAADAARLIGALPRGSRVVVVGGDGTVHPLLPALLAGGHELGLVPAGSGDDGARALGLRGRPPAAALAHALAAPAVPVDLGVLTTPAGRTLFLSSLCAGFDAAVAARAQAAPKMLGGLPRYLLATLQELAVLAPFEAAVRADGLLVHEGPVLFASTLNTPTYGGGMPAVPDARIDDGRLDLLIAGRFGRAGALAMLPLLLAGAHRRHPRVRSLRAARIEIDADRALPLAADGEPLAPAARLALDVAAAALRIVRA